MKKFNLGTVAALAAAVVLTAAFSGCSSSSSDDGNEEEGKIESVSIASSAEEVEAGTNVTLTADVKGNISAENVTYNWKVTENAEYGTLSAAEGKQVSLALKNTDENAHIVKVTLTASNKNNAENTATDDVYVKVKGASGSTELPEDEKQLEEEKKEDENQENQKTGGVSVNVTLNDETQYVTVKFVDPTENGNETKTFKVKSGEKVTDKIPDWTREGYLLVWSSSVDGITTESEITQDVTFTAGWSSAHTVTFKDTSAYKGDTVKEDASVEVADGAAIEESKIPGWKKTHYTLSWNPSLDLTAAVTADATYTAVWTEDEKFTVTFTDSDSSNGNEDVTQNVYSGEKASVPSWSKENYTLSWSSSVDGVSIDSVITQEVTFTANWTEKPKCSNCGTHYDTQAEADACSKQSGCPKFVAVAAGIYDLTTGGKVFSKQSAGESQTHNGITVTCTIDSRGANLKTDKNGSNGLITFAIASDMTLTFTDSVSKGVVISTTDGYVGESGTTKSETLTSATKLKLGAGNYTIVGATSSSAKIASLTFAETAGE